MEVKLCFFTILSLAQLLNSSTATDYCSICSEHIACINNEAKFSENCPADAKIAELSSEIKNSIVAEHNKLRNKVASGGEPNFKQAAKMNILKWNDELAYLAQLNVKQCEMEHDECRATDEFPHAGQNLYMKMSSPDFSPLNKTIISGIQSWYKEIIDAKQSDIDKCCGERSRFNKIGHFLQMMQDKNTAVGCAVSMFTDSKNWKIILLACNYGFSNLRNEAVYESGDAASYCSNKDSIYTSLCVA